jgi:hypothetical protein
MPASIVFRGDPASAYVVAGFLRTSGFRLVEVIPAVTPYPAGPLRHGFVRVEERGSEAERLLGEQRLDRPLESGEFSMPTRLFAACLAWSLVLTGV